MIRHLHSVMLAMLSVPVALYGAAESTKIIQYQTGMLDECIGLSVSSRGSYAFLSSEYAEDSSSQIQICVAYSEHPALQDRSILMAIAQTLAKISPTYDITKLSSRAEMFHIACYDEITKYSVPQLEDATAEAVTSQREISDLVVSRIKLGIDKIAYLHATKQDENWYYGAGRQKLWCAQAHGGRRASGKVATGFGLVNLFEPIVCSQIEAEELQKDSPRRPFHLVIDLAKWR